LILNLEPGVSAGCFRGIIGNDELAPLDRRRKKRATRARAPRRATAARRRTVARRRFGFEALHELIDRGIELPVDREVERRRALEELR
jgi:hypothetical protein